MPISRSHLLPWATLCAALTLAACYEARHYIPYDPDAMPATPTVPALRFPPNNSYRGSVITGSLRPTFQWEPSTWTGPEVIRYELQFSTDKTFATGVTTVQTTGTSHQPTANLPVSKLAPVGARYYWRVKACVGDACSAPSMTWWVNLGRVERDVNGDGFADMVVTASGDGTLYMFLGGPGTQFNNIPDTVAGAPVWYLSIESAGDLNADGFADVAIRVTDQAKQRFRPYVLFGGPGTTLDTTPDAIFNESRNSRLAQMGDLNADGFDDLSISDLSDNVERADVFYGGAGATFDTTVDSTVPVDQVASAGDVNGDGLGDIIASSPSYAGRTGRAYIYFSDASMNYDVTPAGTIDGQSVADQFGYSISSAGDMNGDGFGDIVVGAPSNDANGIDAGRAYVYLGGPGPSFDTFADGIMTAFLEKDQLGIHVASAGDLNGDGYSDLAVSWISNGLPIENLARGGVQIFLGGPGGAVDNSVDTQLVGEQFYDMFGERVAGADVNGDGFSDLLVAATGNDTPAPNAGRAYVFLGDRGRTLEPYPDGVLNGQKDQSLGLFANIERKPAPTSPALLPLDGLHARDRAGHRQGLRGALHAARHLQRLRPKGGDIHRGLEAKIR
jgi:FG-GAP repeat/FG-GAP-like repeat